MKDPLREPPPVLHGARVREYALLDNSVRYSGHSSLFVDGEELGPVPCLAICQSSNDIEVFLMHCATDWSILGVAEYPSIADAKNRAEHVYAGSSKLWIEAPTTAEEAVEYLETNQSIPRCSFCGKGPDEIEQLVSKNQANICNLCITEFHEMLNDESSVKD